MSDEQQKNPHEPVIKVVDDADRKAKPFEHSIYFEHTSEVDGVRRAGNFTFKKLTLGGISRVGVIRARRNGGFTDDQIDDATAYLNNAIAHLTVWFESNENLPPWAKNWDQLVDVAIPVALYKEGSSFEGSFRRPVGQQHGETAPDSRSTSPG